MVISGNPKDCEKFLVEELGVDIICTLAALQTYKTETNKMAGMEVTEENADEMLRTYVLALHCELDELLAEFNWKPWKKTKKVVDKEHAAKEFGDIIAFVGAMIVTLNKLGIRTHALGNGYIKAELENLRRFNGDY